MSLASTSYQINNLKQLIIFLLFVLFYLDIENRKKILALKLRKN